MLWITALLDMRAALYPYNDIGLGLCFRGFKVLQTPCRWAQRPDPIIVCLGTARGAPLRLIVLCDPPCEVEAHARPDDAEHECRHQSELRTEPPTGVAADGGADECVETGRAEPSTRDYFSVTISGSCFGFSLL